MARRLAVFGLIISTLLSVSAQALTIGEIELDSALNQPFSAGVSLNASSAEELDTLQVSLASQQAFEDYGLDRPAFLRDIRFQVVRKSPTVAELRMEGTQPIIEPFVMMLVRFNWSAGNMYREYTVLLDPPVFDTAAPAADVEPAQTNTSEAEPASQPIQRSEQVQSAPAVAAPVAAAPASSQQRSVPRQPSFNGDAYGPIANGSSLWKIADRLKEGTGLTINQMMVALYRANPEAFMGNINRLKAGSILRMPEAGQMEAMSVAEANAEVRSQHQAWKSGSSAPVRDEPAQLKLMPPSEAALAGDGAGDGVESAGGAGEGAGGDSAALRSELEETRRLLALKDQELVELQERLARMEAEGADTTAAAESAEDLQAELDELAEQSAEDAAAYEEAMTGGSDEEAAGEELVDDAAAEGDDIVATDAEAEEAVEEVAEEVPAASTMPAASTAVTTDSDSSGSLMDAVMGVLTSLWLWIAVGVLAVVGFVFFRRRQPAPAIGTGLDDETETGVLGLPEEEVDDSADAPRASPVPDDFERQPMTDSMVVEEGLAEDFLKSPEEAAEEFGTPGDDADTPAESTAEIPALDEDASIGGELDVAPPDDFDIGLDTIGSDNQDILLDDEVELEKTAELSPGEGPDPTATIGSETAINLDHTDPIAEADFHMAYGLYDQAAELLVKALEDDPEDKMLRVKLLEVYFVWENKDGFIEEARKLRDAVDDSDPEWNKVIIMGQQICPDDELFANAEGAAGSQILDVRVESDDGLEGGLDVDFGAESDDEVDVDLNFDPGNTSIGLGDDNATLDFDIGSESPTMETPTIEAPGAESPTMETPTIEAPGSESPTMETPTIEAPGAESPTMETPTIETPIPGGRDETSSIALDDLDVDLGDLDGIDEDFSADLGDLDLDNLDLPGDEEAPAEQTQSDIGVDPDDGSDITAEDISSDDVDFDLGGDLGGDFGNDEVELGDNDATMLASNVDVAIEDALAADAAAAEESADEATQNEIADDDPTLLADADDLSQFIQNDIESADIDLPDLDIGDAEPAGDTVEQPALVNEGDTVEQPSIDESTGDPDSLSFSDDVFGGEADASDSHAETHALDALDESVLNGGSLDDSLGEAGGADTQLDLARAYIDMGDADGARDILNEVLEEGGEAEQDQARQLLAKLDS